MSVFKTLAATPAASTTTTASSVSSNSVVVTKDNFKQYMNVSGSATFDQDTGIVTLTPDVNSVKGAISLNTRLDSNRSFVLQVRSTLVVDMKGTMKEQVRLLSLGRRYRFCFFSW